MDQPTATGPPKPASTLADASPSRTRHKTIEETTDKPAGIRVSTHGITYQIKLLMLFMLRARKHGHTFSLGTEVADADKFDDVVFSCHTPGDAGKQYRFLQAKHRQDDSDAVKTDNLLSAGKDDFSILKYFVSYRKIKQNDKIDGELKDFIICTNIDVDTQVQKSVVEVDSSGDEIFAHNNIKAKLYKIKKHSNLHNSLVSTLKRKHFDSLAARVAKIAFNKKIEPDSLIHCYRGWLLDNVLKVDTVNNKRCIVFHDKFSQNQCDDVFLETFRTELIASYRTLRRTNTIKDIDNILQNTIIALPQTFTLDTKGSLSPDVADEEVDDFFDKLILAVKQPNQLELGKIIAEELGQNMNISDGKLVSSRLLEFMLDWVNEKIGRFLQPNDIEEIFHSLKCDFASSGLIGNSLLYKFKFKKCYNFKDNVEVIKAVKDFLNGGKRQVLTVYHKNHLLSAIKILQVIADTKADENISIDLESLEQLEGTAACPREAFRSDAYNHLIIDIEPMTSLDDATRILKVYFETLRNRPEKRIILIVSHKQQLIAERPLQELFKQTLFSDEKYMQVVDHDNNVLDLTTESQHKLIKQSKVIFLGNQITLKTVIDENKELVNEEILSKLISNETIEFGKAFSDENYEAVKDFFVDREFQRCIKINESILVAKDDFFVTLNSQVTECDLVANQEIILISEYEADFKDLCQRYSNRVIHWLRNCNEYGCVVYHNEHSVQHKITVLPNNDVSEFDIQTNPVIILVSNEEEDYVELRERYDEKVIYWIELTDKYIVRDSHNLFKDLNETEGETSTDEQIYISSSLNRTSDADVRCGVIMAFNDNFLIKLKHDQDDGNQSDSKQADVNQDDSKHLGDIRDDFNREGPNHDDSNESTVMCDFKVLYAIRYSFALFWQQTHGNLSKLREHVGSQPKWIQKKDKYLSKQIMSSSDKVAIIAATPGMGKSTVLGHVVGDLGADSCLGLQWIVGTDLKNHLREFFNLIAVDKKEAVTFLYNVVFNLLENDEHEQSVSQFITIDGDCKVNLEFDHEADISRSKLLQVELFTHFYNDGKVVVCLDGYDEISPDCKGVVLDLIDTLKHTRVQKIWVTTRPYNIQSELEDRLGTFAYEIVPLHEHEQEYILMKFWEKKLNIKITHEYFKYFVDKIWEIISSNIGSGASTFRSIPLHINMIATVYEKEFKEFFDSVDETIVSNLTLNFTLYGLYDKFLNLKLGIAYKEVTGSLTQRYAMELYRAQSLENHKYLALFELFSENELKELLSEEKIRTVRDLIQSVKEAKEKTGLIDSVMDGKPHFVHRAYAEHLAADLLGSMLDPRDQKYSACALTFLYNVLTKAGSQSWVLFKIMNYKIVANCDSSDVLTEAINGDLMKSAAHNENIRDPFGRTPLHLASFNMDFLLYRMESQSIKSHYLVKDKLFDWTPLHYALLCLSQYSIESPTDRQINILDYICEQNCLNIQDMNGKTLIILATQLDFNHSWLGVMLQHEPDLSIKDNKGRTALHYAVLYSHRLVPVLIKHGADPFVKDDGGKTPLHIIFEHQNILAWDTYLKALLTSNKERDLVKYSKKTITKVDKDFVVRLLSTSHESIYFFLENSLLDVNTQDSHGRTALHIAADNIIKTKILLRYKADPNIRDNSGTAPLHLTLNKYHETIDLLMCGAYFDIVDVDDLPPDNCLISSVANFVNSVKTNDMHGIRGILNGCEDSNYEYIVNAKSKDSGKSPLDYAAASGYKDIIDCLISHGAWRFSQQHKNVKIDLTSFIRLKLRNRKYHKKHEQTYRLAVAECCSSIRSRTEEDETSDDHIFKKGAWSVSMSWP